MTPVGLLVFGGTGLQVTGNTYNGTGVTDTGIYLIGASGATVQNNHINTADYGITEEGTIAVDNNINNLGPGANDFTGIGVHNYEYFPADGSASPMTVEGSDGVDFIALTTSVENVEAGDGNDTIELDKPSDFTGDTVDGGDGTADTLEITGAGAYSFGTNGSLINVEKILIDGAVAANIDLSTQTDGFDITGSTAANNIVASQGSDTIHYAAGDGADTIDGHDGIDTLALTGTTGNDSIVINGTSWSGTAAPASVTNVENISVDLLNGDDSVSISNPSNGSTYTINGGEGATDHDTLTVDLTTGGDGTTGQPVTLTVSNNGTPLVSTDDRVLINVDGVGAAEISVKDVENITINALDGADTISATGLFTNAGVNVNTITVNLGAGNDTFNATGSNVDFIVNGEAGQDDITGGDLADVLTGGADADTFHDGLGGDAIYGGVVGADDPNTTIDVAVYGVGATISWNGTAWEVNSGANGIDTLHGIEKVTVNGAAYWLVDNDATNGGFSSINDAITAATAGDTILVAAGTYSEDVNFSKSVVVLGAKAGTDGDAGGRATSASTGTGETNLIGNHIISTAAPVTIDGLRFVNDATTTGGGSVSPTLKVQFGGTGPLGHEITNSVFWSNISGAANDDRAISHDPLATGTITISDNLFSGSIAGAFGTASWGRAIWSDGTGVNLDIVGNTFKYARTALNLDTPGTTVDVDGNAFDFVGTAVSIGLTAGGTIDWITNNSFNLVDTDFNFRGTVPGFTFDASANGNTYVDGTATGPNLVKILGGDQADTITGTAYADYIAGDASTNSAGTNFGAGSATPDANTLSGLAGDDTIFGSAGNDSIDGGADNDALQGGGGDDTFTGGLGNDAIYGGSNVTDMGVADTAVYADVRDHYTIAVTTGPGGFVTGFTGITDDQPSTLGDEGTDTLNGIERLSFNGGARVLDLNQAVQVFHDHDANSGTPKILVGTYASIQAAIDNAGTLSGDTILVSSSYALINEDVNVTKALTIQSVGASKAQVASFNIGPSVLTGGANVTIDHFTVVPEGAGPEIGIQMNGAFNASGGPTGSITITNTDVSGFANNGLFISGGGTNSVRFAHELHLHRQWRDRPERPGASEVLRVHRQRDAHQCRHHQCRDDADRHGSRPPVCRLRFAGQRCGRGDRQRHHQRRDGQRRLRQDARLFRRLQRLLQSLVHRHRAEAGQRRRDRRLDRPVRRRRLAGRRVHQRRHAAVHAQLVERHAGDDRRRASLHQAGARHRDAHRGRHHRHLWRRPDHRRAGHRYGGLGRWRRYRRLYHR